MGYMLDTNVCIAIMKGHQSVQAKVSQIPLTAIGISGIVLAELAYGVQKSAHRSHNEKALTDFCAMCQVFDWPSDAARTYGAVRADLEARGRVIGANDLLIAAHAKYVDAVLVTRNVREFQRIPGLLLEDWVSDGV